MSEFLNGVIKDQHRRIVEAGVLDIDQMNDLLNEAGAEIVDSADVHQVADLYVSDATPEREAQTLTQMMRASIYRSSISNRLGDATRTAHFLSNLDGEPMIIPNQGYIGGIIMDGDDRIVYGHSIRGPLDTDVLGSKDPIQKAVNDHEGGYLYPVMSWVKALRAQGYMQRPESAQDMTISQYLAEMGCHLGSMVMNRYGDIAGASGFMPAPRLKSLDDTEPFATHMKAEPVEAFVLSGLCDQAVLDVSVLENTQPFALDIIERGGNLN